MKFIKDSNESSGKEKVSLKFLIWSKGRQNWERMYEILKDLDEIIESRNILLN